MIFLLAAESMRESNVTPEATPHGRVTACGRANGPSARRYHRQRRILLDEAEGACTEANNQNGGRIIHLPESLSL